MNRSLRETEQLEAHDWRSASEVHHEAIGIFQRTGDGAEHDGGPAMFFCGALDDIVGCDGAASALNAVTTLPALYAENLSVDHGSWMSFGNAPSPTYAAITAWMRVHLLADEALRPWFYGPSCQLCGDEGWQVEQKNMQ